MKRIGINPCECGKIPDIRNNEYGTPIIQCDCAFLIVATKYKTQEELINWWNKKHPVKSRDEMISTDHVKKTTDRLLNNPSSPESLKEVSEATPNCGICKYHTFETSVAMLTETELKISICTAQGYKNTGTCYNTPECKKLYIKENQIEQEESDE